MDYELYGLDQYVAGTPSAEIKSTTAWSPLLTYLLPPGFISSSMAWC